LNETINSSLFWQGNISVLHYVGNVGIGTTSPLEELHIQELSASGSPNSGYQLVLESLDDRAGIRFRSPSDKNASIQFDDNNMYFETQGEGNFKIYSNGSERMIVTNEGRMGIGTNTPGATYLLDVAGNVRVQGDLDVVGNYSTISVQNLDINGSITPQQDAMFNVGNSTNRWMNGTFAGVVQAGNLVVGGDSYFAGNLIPSADNTYSLGNSTSQWKDLYVSTNTIYINGTPLTSSDGSLQWGGSNISLGNSLWQGNSSVTYYNGNVGIGTTSPIKTLDVNGTTQNSGKWTI
jgi:hypothetical protein